MGVILHRHFTIIKYSESNSNVADVVDVAVANAFVVLAAFADESDVVVADVAFDVVDVVAVVVAGGFVVVVVVLVAIVVVYVLIGGVVVVVDAHATDVAAKYVVVVVANVVMAIVHDDDNVDTSVRVVTSADVDFANVANADQMGVGM